jgi:hypothetical protein
MLLARFTAEHAAIPPALVAGPVQARITGHLTAELAQAGRAALHAWTGSAILARSTTWTASWPIRRRHRRRDATQARY